VQNIERIVIIDGNKNDSNDDLINLKINIEI
jgi:hypothetical protein